MKTLRSRSRWAASLLLSMAAHIALFTAASWLYSWAVRELRTPPAGNVASTDADPPLVFLFYEEPPPAPPEPTPAPAPPTETEPAEAEEPSIPRPEPGFADVAPPMPSRVQERADAEEQPKTTALALSNSSDDPSSALSNAPAVGLNNRQIGIGAPAVQEAPSYAESALRRLDFPEQRGIDAQHRAAVGRSPRLYAGSRSRRGAGSAGAASYGTGSNAQPSYMVDPYQGVMRKLAEGIVESTEAEKLDVTFLVDITGSMEDNVRGVRAYADQFASILRRHKRDVRYGLVTFTDASIRAPQAKGMTDSSLDLRNWLYGARFVGGGGLAESSLEAVMTALQKLDYREDARKRFILISDGPFHDRDYNGASDLTMDAVIETLKQRRVTLDSVSIDFLPMKQIAWGTGGQWTKIPGKGHLESFLQPLPVQSNAALGVLSTQTDRASDEIYIFVPPDKPVQWYQLTWRLLNPRGEKIQGEFTARQSAVGQRKITFRPEFDPEWFRGLPGLYTVIYRVTDSSGKSSALRRTMDYR